ncbi:MAG: Ldh family oxidoreductase [Bacteroidales bacterium]|nr:Ldh family oxidoreductase [Bacteroidales bacterium]
MRIEAGKLKKIIKKIFIHAGALEKNAEIIADALVLAELRGIPSHGIIRVKDYLMLVKNERMVLNPEIQVVSETPSTALIDGGNGPGMVVGKFAMEFAIEKAQQVGSAWVAVRNSNHFGIAAYYTLMAAEKDMIGFAMTNGNPLVAPTFGLERLLGTNPIAMSIPSKSEGIFTADFATTPIPRGKFEIMEKTGQKAPWGVLQDADGNITDDPSVLKRGGAILPLGGDYEHAGYKGYCLAAMVDILSSVVSGANFGPFVPPQVAYLPLRTNLPGKGLGHFFGALKMDAFRPADEIKQDMDLWIKTFRTSKSVAGKQVLIPGDPEVQKHILYEKEGIPILPEVWNELINTLSVWNLKLEEYDL